jgi:hypothetical protein
MPHRLVTTVRAEVISVYPFHLRTNPSRGIQIPGDVVPVFKVLAVERVYRGMVKASSRGRLDGLTGNPPFPFD